MKEIKLTQVQVALVDDDRFDELNSHKWQAQWNPKTKSFYATRRILETDKIEKMHRRILGAPRGKQVDHIDGNTLNNCISNLRLVTNRQNCQNRHRITSSIYPGVSWDKARRKWSSQIQINGNFKHLGRFSDEREAFESYLLTCKNHGFPVDFLIEKFGIYPDPEEVAVL